MAVDGGVSAKGRKADAAVATKWHNKIAQGFSHGSGSKEIRPEGATERVVRTPRVFPHGAQILDCDRPNGHVRHLVRAPFQGASRFVIIPRANALGYSVMPLRGIRLHADTVIGMTNYK